MAMYIPNYGFPAMQGLGLNQYAGGITGLTGTASAPGQLGNINYGIGTGSGIGFQTGIPQNMEVGTSFMNQPTNDWGGLGLNMDTMKLGLSGLQTLGGIWNAFQTQKLARDQFKHTRDVTNTNLNNSIKSYNTALEGRARARGAMEGRSEEYTQEYIDRNKLSRQ